jgi:hypothetical protein
VASCGGGSQPFASGGRDPARQALRPGREELAITEPPAEAQAEVDDGEGSAGPGEPKTATVERREASVPRHGTQGASQRLTCRVRHVSRVLR